MVNMSERLTGFALDMICSVYAVQNHVTGDRNAEEILIRCPENNGFALGILSFICHLNLICSSEVIGWFCNTVPPCKNWSPDHSAGSTHEHEGATLMVRHTQISTSKVSRMARCSTTAVGNSVVLSAVVTNLELLHL